MSEDVPMVDAERRTWVEGDKVIAQMVWGDEEAFVSKIGDLRAEVRLLKDGTMWRVEVARIRSIE